MLIKAPEFSHQIYFYLNQLPTKDNFKIFFGNKLSGGGGVIGKVLWRKRENIFLKTHFFFGLAKVNAATL